MAIVGSIALLATLAACVFFRVSRPQDVAAYYHMAQECHSVWRPLALRSINEGDSAAKLVLEFPPSRRDDFGRYATYGYVLGGRADSWFTGIEVAARDGRLIRATAWSCTWEFTFFDDGDPELDAQNSIHIREQIARLQQLPTAGEQQQ